MATLLGVKDAAQALNVSEDTIRRWAKMGLVRATRDERNRRMIDLEEVRHLQDQLAGKASGRGFTVLKADKIFEEATCIDLFAGAGGTALGFHNAGLNHVFLNEFDSDAVKTLEKNSTNHGLNWNISGEDVHDVDFTGLEAKVIQAGVPCQAFSYAGKSLGFSDTRGTLFFEFARAVEQVKPEIAIVENVRGLVNHDGGRTLATMLKTLDQLGYVYNYRILRAQYMDVPQKRERLFIFAVRKDTNHAILFPKEKGYVVTLREALEGCPKSQGAAYPAKKRAVLELVPEGGNWRDLPDETAREFMGGSYFLGGGRTGMARRMAWDQPSLTLTCSPAQKQTERCHPTETRPFTVREYARIQTFPDDWEFCGSLAHQYKQIGNAVPVNLGYYVGRCVLASLGHIDIDNSMEEVEPLN